MLMNNSGYQQPVTPMAAPVPPTAPVQQPVEVPVLKSKKDLIKNIVIAALAVCTVLFLVLFFLESSKYNEMSADFDSKVASAAAKKVDEEVTKVEKEYNAKYNQPYSSFVGPEDYGRIEFKYPRTWSVYVASDGSAGSNYAAYFNPNEVTAINKETAYALSIEIVNETFEKTTEKYDAKGSGLSSRSVSINGSSAVYYTGTIPETKLSGAMLVIKNRDKTVILKTYDSAFLQDFESIIDTITFNS